MGVAYKVFLVEDEVTTREGIRDNVDWLSTGFELCGEASDGEIALPQIEAPAGCADHRYQNALYGWAAAVCKSSASTWPG